nr:hypothetical protein [Tanacetum cinerariifolium]
MVPPNNLGPDLNGKAINDTQYRGFDLKGYLDSEYVRCNMDRKSTSDFISKCCLREAFTRSPNQYKEYLSEFWYAARTHNNLKVWFSTPTGGILGEVGVNTFRNTIGAHYLSYSSEYVAPPSIETINKKTWENFASYTRFYPYYWNTKGRGGKTGGFDQITNKDAIILYSLANRVNIHYEKLIWEDVITKINKKTWENFASYTRFYPYYWNTKGRDVPVEHKAPNTSSYIRKKNSKDKKPRARSGHRKQPTFSKHYPLSKIEATK